MTTRPRRSLEARVYGVTLLVLVASVGVHGFLQARTAVREHRTLVLEGVRASLANLSESVARRLIIEDFAAMDELLARAARLPGILRIQVCNLQGAVLSEVRRDGDRARSSVVPDPARIAVPATGASGDALAEDDGDTAIVLWEPVKVGPEAIGYVRETYDVSPLRASVRAIRERALLVITGAVLVGLALLLWALRGPLGAIRRLAEYARDLDVHKGEQIAIPRGTIEVRELGEALNHASAALARSEQRLVEEGEAKRALQSRLLESQKMEALGLMAGCIAHDFNNLLTVITGSARLAADGAPAGTREDLEHILLAAERGTALTRSLLAFGRRQPLVIAPVDLNVVVRGLEGLLRKLAGTGLELRVCLAPQPVRVMADPDQLTQVLANLVTNARDAMRGGGVLTVATGRAPAPRRTEDGTPGPETGWIAVSDTGVGMGDEVRARIFEPFFTTKPRGSGTGLGMAIVHGIVSQHGGAVEVESRVGAGTTFRVLLPLANATVLDDAHPVAMARLRRDGRRDDDAGAQPVRAAPRPARRRTLLLVEDDPQVAHVLRRALEGQGHTVLVAASGRQGLQALADAAGAVDLLLSDVAMPDMNGVELLKEARRAVPGLPAILMSGYTADALDSRRCALPRDVPLLGKPVTATSVHEAVEEILARTERGRPGAATRPS